MQGAAAVALKGSACQTGTAAVSRAKGSLLAWMNLCAAMAPGALFAAALWSWRSDPRLLALTQAWHPWVMAFFGLPAAAAGFGDWLYHRLTPGCVLCPLERRYEAIALFGGGLPLFALMLAATLAPRPELFLLPILVCVLFISVLVCYDEFIFHRRRCRPWETVLHRILVFGNAGAWLTWMDWCFVHRGA